MSTGPPERPESLLEPEVVLVAPEVLVDRLVRELRVATEISGWPGPGTITVTISGTPAKMARLHPMLALMWLLEREIDRWYRQAARSSATPGLRVEFDLGASVWAPGIAGPHPDPGGTLSTDVVSEVLSTLHRAINVNFAGW